MAILGKPDLPPGLKTTLSAAGLGKNKTDTEDISSKLKDHDLTLDDALGELSLLIRSTTNESLKLKAIENVFKLNGALKESAPLPPTINVIIADPFQDQASPAINPIFIPRPYQRVIEVDPEESETETPIQ